MPLPGTCVGCKHPDRLRLDTALRNGVAILTLEKSFGISHNTLRKHFAEHVDVSAPRELAPVEMVRLAVPDDVTLELQWLYSQQKWLYGLAKADRDQKNMNAALNSAGQTLDKAAKAVKLYADNITVSIERNPFDDLSPAQLRALIARCEVEDPTLTIEMDMLNVTPDGNDEAA